jgi:hypothetical protein
MTNEEIQAVAKTVARKGMTVTGFSEPTRSTDAWFVRMTYTDGTYDIIEGYDANIRAIVGPLGTTDAWRKSRPRHENDGFISAEDKQKIKVLMQYGEEESANEIIDKALGDADERHASGK